MQKWYLVGLPSHKNLAACVSVQLTQSLEKLRRAEQAEILTAEEKQHSREKPRHPRTRAEKHTQQVRRDERMSRYEQIVALRSQGMKSADIAEKLGMAERTIRGWLSRGDIPYSRPRKQRPRLIDPYKPYLLERWHQGCRNGSQLERELRAKGYKGSQRAVYRYLEALEPSGRTSRKHRSASVTGEMSPPMQHNPLLTLSAQQATWLFFRRPEDLEDEELETLRQLRQASPEIETTYQLVEAFLHMVRELKGEQLDAWLFAVETSHLEAFQSFVTGIQKDKDAVFAGLTLSWSNGPLEGNVNRLKLIKKSMYGRAEFDLLKIRVLYRSKKVLERKNKRKNRQAQLVDRLKKPRRMKNGTNSQHTTIEISKVA